MNTLVPVSFAQARDHPICILVAVPPWCGPWWLLDLATRNSRDSSVYVPAIQNHHTFEQPSESWRVLARVLTHSVVGTSGCREFESPLVLVVFLDWSTLAKS